MGCVGGVGGVGGGVRTLTGDLEGEGEWLGLGDTFLLSPCNFEIAVVAS